MNLTKYINEELPDEDMSNNRSLLGEAWDFLKVRKAWWLTPIVVLLVLVGALIIVGQGSAVSPFIYALF